ncbi:MAG TPA: hypothetical protein VGF97_18875 [Rhizomicrobium sp.]|jgi:hypothetical protein
MDNAIKLSATVGGVVCILSVGATLLALNLLPAAASNGAPKTATAGPWEEYAKALASTSPPGRYAIVFSPHVERSTFLLDTETGRVWVHTTFSDLMGEPDAWDYMERLDDPGAALALAKKYGYKHSGIPTADFPEPLPPGWANMKPDARFEYCLLTVPPYSEPCKQAIHSHDSKTPREKMTH